MVGVHQSSESYMLIIISGVYIAGVAYMQVDRQVSPVGLVQ